MRGYAVKFLAVKFLAVKFLAVKFLAVKFLAVKFLAVKFLILSRIGEVVGAVVAWLIRGIRVGGDERGVVASLLRRGSVIGRCCFRGWC
jgi:hypothetical protein